MNPFEIFEVTEPDAVTFRPNFKASDLVKPAVPSKPTFTVAVISSLKDIDPESGDLYKSKPFHSITYCDHKVLLSTWGFTDQPSLIIDVLESGTYLAEGKSTSFPSEH